MTAEPRTAAQPLSGSAALRRSGLAIAGGTVASRLTGFVRTAVVGVAIGYAVGESYNAANTIPNILYDLLLGGILSAVVIPLLTHAARRDADGGTDYAERLISLVVIVLAVVSVVAVLLAPVLISLYAGPLHPPARHLAVSFARFFLPQVLFYGAGAVIGAVLNTRDRFAAPMWAPVLNNLIVIASGALFLAMTHGRVTPGDVHGASLLVLAVGTTAGIIAQTVVLLPSLRRAGVPLRLRLNFRGMGLRSAGGFAGWTLVYVLVNQLGYLVVTRLAIAAGKSVGAHEVGYSAYSYAYVLFSMPFAVVAVTVITALFPAMSRSGDAGDYAEVRRVLDRGITVSGVLLVPATGALLAFGPLIASVVFGHGRIDLLQARLTGAALGAFAVGLVPFAAFQMQFRAWLSLRDARTPALINLVATLVNVVADLILYVALPADHRVIGLAAGFSLSYFVALAISSHRLQRRLGAAARHGLVLRTHVRLIIASIVGTVPAYFVSRAITGALGDRPAAALLATAVAVTVGFPIFLLVARRLRVAELRDLTGLVRRRSRA